MPKIRQTNKVMKVGNQWLPAFLNSVNGSPTYTYINDQGQWANASGNTYSVEHPLDEVTVKYDPKTGGQINKAAPDYWRQYGQRRMQQTAGDVDKVIMGTVGAATAPLWLPEIYGAGLVLSGNPAVQQFANQVLYGLGADAALKATTGYDYSEAGQRLFSNPLQRIGLSKDTSDYTSQLIGNALNPGYYMPAMKYLKPQLFKRSTPVYDMDQLMSVNTLPELKPLNNLDFITHPTIVGVGSEAGAYALMKDQNLPDYVEYPTLILAGMAGAGGGHALNKYAKNLNIKSPFLNDMLKYPATSIREMFRGNYAFGPIDRAIQRRTKKESDYMNYVYDDLVHNYIGKKLYPGFNDVKPSIKPVRHYYGSEAEFQPYNNSVVTKVFRGPDTRMMYPFDMYRKGQIAHETTHAVINRANEYNYGATVYPDGHEHTVWNTVKPLSVYNDNIRYYNVNPELFRDETDIMNDFLHNGSLEKINPYTEHLINLTDMKSPYYSKKWMSNPEEWFAEYSNIVNRLTGKVVPVSDLSPTNKKIVKKFFMHSFGADDDAAENALKMLNTYQHDYLQGFNVRLN